MKIIFFGLGSIGQRHAKILQKNFNHQLFAFRSGVSKTQNSLGIKELYSWQEVENLKPDVAFITNPTSLHIETALKCAKLNLKLFIEKPIDNKLDNLDKLLEVVQKNNLITYVAYNLRFHPVIEELKKYIQKYKFFHMSILTTSFYPNWRPNTDYKKRYSANADLGGGIILDLSHELDYSQFLIGEIEPFLGEFSKRSNLTNNVEDYADILINTKKGPANIHINFLSHKKQRIIQIDFEEKTVVGDLINFLVEEYENEKLILKKQFDATLDTSYEKQMRYFFDNINNPLMMNNLVEAATLFKEIIKFKQHKNG